jgi:hypothetical protein
VLAQHYNRFSCGEPRRRQQSSLTPYLSHFSPPPLHFGRIYQYFGWQNQDTDRAICDRPRNREEIDFGHSIYNLVQL